MFMLNKLIKKLITIMPNIIDSIQLSGVTYTLSAQTSGGGNNVIELTQAEYDALVTKDPTAFYIITDATAFDPSTKLDTSAFTSYSASTDTAIASKQDTLVSGTNIKTINNESILGSGNITIESGGGMDEDMEKLISSALVDLNDRKIDASEVKSNYQRKGDYATKSELSAKANASEVMTFDKSKENELVTAQALNDLNNRLGGLSLVKLTQSEYDALATKDSNTLYVIVN